MKEARELLNEFLDSGHGACPGCAMPLILRHVFHILGKDTVAAITAGCFGTISGIWPNSPIKLAAYNTPFASAAAAASGIRASLDMQGKTQTQVLAVAGDGGTFDIGIQALSGAAERNDDFIYVCYDNEAYMNTGIQRSSATPWGAWTTTTPPANLKNQPKKDIVQIMAAHRIPYAATASIAYPEDFFDKMTKAKGIKGFRFIHLLSTCPTGWRIPSQLSVKAARLAVLTRIFPLYEVEYGERYVINFKPEFHPVKEYLKLQGRFAHLTDPQIESIQQAVNKGWEKLIKKAS